MTARLFSFFSAFFSLFIATLVLVAGANSGSAAGRVALVIGNSAYQALPVLPNPANDATDVATELGEMGYDVTVRTNATRSEMANVVARFAEKMQGAELALLFYAGHGVQLNGENYLLPVDATGESEAALRLSTIDLSSLQDAMADARANVIILDACRNNPFADAIAAHRGIGVSRGLTPMDTRGRGSLIVFSTKPNSVAADGDGRNSPFTAALIRHMSARGLEIRQMISRVRKDVLAATGDQQVPWDNSSLVDDVYLGEASATVPCPAHTSPSDPGRASDRASGPLRGRFHRRFGCASPQPVHGVVAARPGALCGSMGGGRDLPKFEDRRDPRQDPNHRGEAANLPALVAGGGRVTWTSPGFAQCYRCCARG